MVRYLLLISILLLLLQASFCIHLAHEENDDQKVKVDFYYQTICPHSKSFVLGPLKEAA
jgi:GTP cyclohydrolase FolE2